ncbi:MAG: bifunctional isocitrate dehydrogenase kinase/phosphatase [Deltaproteobacteria bacterium]|nr:MAG: bifunctional isocitrate dehydrogenase kinase/phosphatase [Deltaproteobacteria bacterium]
MTSANDNLPEQAAQAIRRAFDSYQAQYAAITQRAQARFEGRDWPGMQVDAGERLDLYKKVVDETVVEIKRVLGGRVKDPEAWKKAKVAYADLVVKVDLWELAETFFNSITRRIFATVGVNPQIEFVDTCSRTQPVQIGKPVYRSYMSPPTTGSLIETILGDYNFAVDYEDLRRDAELVAAKIEDHLNKAGSANAIQQADMVTSVLFRGKGAYLIGRVYSASSNFPLVLALLNTSAGIVVDAVLLDEDEVSILFSFTRAYFHVNVGRPAELVGFLKSIMPRKRIAELYISIGYNKHGKSELYCDLLQHLESSKEKFEIAAGERGMVMEVFTMPDYDLVFKVIKDRFPPNKNTTREEVMAKYYLVFKHDRAGRLVDAQEFEHLKFDRSRFSEDLLEQLQSVAGGCVEVDDDHVVIKHAYVERRVTPLNVYLKEVDDIKGRTAITDYGQAIKDLAATNIFPGDMLLKNFGVTRHGRVVFYDYDELCLLSDCNFRVMPSSRSYEEELSAEPWFNVGENDIFPEEFSYFLGIKGELKDLFLQDHSDLFEVDFWHQIQSRIKARKIIDILPYDQGRRLRRTAH